MSFSMSPSMTEDFDRSMTWHLKRLRMMTLARRWSPTSGRHWRRHHHAQMMPMVQITEDLAAGFYTIAVKRILSEYTTFDVPAASSLRGIRAPDLQPIENLTTTCEQIAEYLKIEQHLHESTRHSAQEPMNLKWCPYHELVDLVAHKLGVRPEDLRCQVRSCADLNRANYKKREKDASTLERWENWQGLAARLTYDIAAIDALIRTEEARQDPTTNESWTRARVASNASGGNTPPEFVIDANYDGPAVWYTPSGRVASADITTLPSPSPSPSPRKRKSSLTGSILQSIKRRKTPSSEDKLSFLLRLRCLLEQVKDQHFQDLTSFVYEGKYRLVYQLSMGVEGMGWEKQKPKPAPGVKGVSRMVVKDGDRRKAQVMVGDVDEAMREMSLEWCECEL